MLPNLAVGSARGPRTTFAMARAVAARGTSPDEVALEEGGAAPAGRRVPRLGFEHPAKERHIDVEAVPGSRAVRRQLLASDGVMGLSMLAEPLTKHYATLSVWRDAAALDAFACAHPHDQLMADLAPAMGPTKLVRWTIKGTDGPPSWTSALERLQ